MVGKVLLGYANDDGDHIDDDNSEFGSGTFQAQKDVLWHIARETGIDPKCWDMKSRNRIFDRLFNLQIGLKSRCDPTSVNNLQVLSSRTLGELDDAIRHLAEDILDDDETHISPWLMEGGAEKLFIYVAEGIEGAGGNANCHIFINVRLNIKAPGIQDVVLRIRYPIRFHVSERIGGCEIINRPLPPLLELNESNENSYSNYIGVPLIWNDVSITHPYTDFYYEVYFSFDINSFAEGRPGTAAAAAAASAPNPPSFGAELQLQQRLLKR